jgi:hypothetical protein
MDSRPILNDVKKIGVFLDSKTFDNQLKQNNRLALSILNYAVSKRLRFVRSPLITEFKELKEIVEYNLVINAGSNPLENRSYFEILGKETHESYLFGYQMKDIKHIADHFHKIGPSGKEELNNIVNVFIQATLNFGTTHSSSKGESNIFITDNDLLLRNRLWFESHFPGIRLNIITLEEASSILDLFFKNNGEYLVQGNHLVSKGDWYWISFRFKIPHFKAGDKIIEALTTRFIYILMAYDEIGKQYFSGVNTDTMDNTLYHFNYLITLITGIFDNLALKSDKSLNIQESPQMGITLSPNRGKRFLIKIRERNPYIHQHIVSYTDFINLIYSFRELIIHREGLAKTAFHFNGNGEKWKLNLIKIHKNTEILIYNLGDSPQRYNPFSKWGLVSTNGDCYLEPFHFSKEIVTILIKFVDKYLELLDYPILIGDQKKRNDSFAQKFKAFEKYHLGL